MKGTRPLSRLQVKAIIRTAIPLRDKALLTLGFSTGYRISELLSLKVKDVSTNGTIHSHVTVKAGNTKTKVGRSVLLNSDSKKALTSLIVWLKSLGMDDNAPLFVSRNHQRGFASITRQQAHKILKSLFAKIGEFGNVATHTLRKTFAAAIYKATGKLELVQIALGHKSINSTISYLAFDNGQVDNAILAMEF